MCAYPLFCNGWAEWSTPTFICLLIHMFLGYGAEFIDCFILPFIIRLSFLSLVLLSSLSIAVIVVVVILVVVVAIIVVEVVV